MQMTVAHLATNTNKKLCHNVAVCLGKIMYCYSPLPPPPPPSLLTVWKLFSVVLIIYIKYHMKTYVGAIVIYYLDNAN